jgi:hypothetical protein
VARSEHIFRLFLVVVLVLAQYDAGAQQSAKLYRVRPGESLRHSVWRDSLYRFDNFTEGRVTFIKGISKTYKLNYSLLSGEMEFIDHDGDSLILRGTPDLRIVNVGGRIFFHHYRAGYIEVLVQMPIALGVKHFLNVERREVTGDNGYGQTSFQTTAVNSIYRQSGSSFSNYDVFYEKAAIYFFIDRTNSPLVATRNSLFRLFPNHRTELKEFLKENRINFRDRKDMMALTNYIARFY